MRPRPIFSTEGPYLPGPCQEPIREDGRSSSGNPGPGNTLAANRLVLLAAAPLFLVLALVAYLTFQFAANEREAQTWVRHTYQGMEAARVLQDDVQTAETSQRGFLTRSRSGLFPGLQGGCGPGAGGC